MMSHGFFAAALLIAAAVPSPGAAETGSPPRARLETVRILRVIDGDTVVTHSGDRIRYIGVDTPETRHPRRPVECLGAEAKETNRKLVEGKVVFLESDVSETDRYGRSLRYVFLPDARGRPAFFVNAELAALGLARAKFYPPDISRKNKIREAERKARLAGKGIWGLLPSRPRGKDRGMVLADPITERFYHPGTQAYEDLRCSPGWVSFSSAMEAEEAGFEEGTP